MNLAKKIQPTGDRLLIRLDRNEKKIGNIIVPGNVREKLDLVISEVVAKGPAVKARNWELAVGDYVMHVRSAVLRYNPEFGTLGANTVADYGFIFEKDCIAAVDPATAINGAAQYTEGRTGTWSQGQS